MDSTSTCSTSLSHAALRRQNPRWKPYALKRTYGFVRGVPSDRYPYRDSHLSQTNSLRHGPVSREISKHAEMSRQVAKLVAERLPPRAICTRASMEDFAERDLGLIELLGTVKDKKGKIKVKGFFDDVEDPLKADLRVGRGSR